MDRDFVIERHMRKGTLVVTRVAGGGAYVASIAVRNEVIAMGRGTSLAAALDGLAEALSGEVAA